MSRMQRQKGARGELEAAELLRPLYPQVRRRCTGEESQGDRGRDLANTGSLVVQVNLSDKPVPERKLKEAESVAKEGQIAIALTRRTRGEWVVSLRPKHFFALLALAEEKERETNGASEPTILRANRQETGA